MRFLLIEDDTQTATFVREELAREGHAVEWTATGREGLRRAETENFEAVVLDCMLPDIDGFAVLETLRARGQSVPVLMLTSLGAIADRVRGLRSGADDYLVKPFAGLELAARVEALARRGSPAIDDVIAIGSLRIDRLGREVWREGRRIVLQPREFELLECLARHPGGVLSRAMLLEQVWHFHFDPQSNLVETHMSRLRQKLNAGFPLDAIRTVRGQGYALRSDV